MTPGTLWMALEATEDRRTKKGRRYPLPAIILIALAAMLSGANDLRAIRCGPPSSGLLPACASNAMFTAWVIGEAVLGMRVAARAVRRRSAESLERDILGDHHETKPPPAAHLPPSRPG